MGGARSVLGRCCPRAGARKITEGQFEGATTARPGHSSGTIFPPSKYWTVHEKVPHADARLARRLISRPIRHGLRIECDDVGVCARLQTPFAAKGPAALTKREARSAAGRYRPRGIERGRPLVASIQLGHGESIRAVIEQRFVADRAEVIRTVSKHRLGRARGIDVHLAHRTQRVQNRGDSVLGIS